MKGVSFSETVYSPSGIWPKEMQAVFPRTPLAGNHQTADCCQLHGPLTPGRISVGRPHCVIPFHGGCDWTEVSLSPVPVVAAAVSNPVFADTEQSLVRL